VISHSERCDPVSASVPVKDEGIPWRIAWLPAITTRPGCCSVMATTSGSPPKLAPPAAQPSCELELLKLAGPA